MQIFEIGFGCIYAHPLSFWTNVVHPKWRAFKLLTFPLPCKPVPISKSNKHRLGSNQARRDEDCWLSPTRWAAATSHLGFLPCSKSLPAVRCARIFSANVSLFRGIRIRSNRWPRLLKIRILFSIIIEVLILGHRPLFTDWNFQICNLFYFIFFGIKWYLPKVINTISLKIISYVYIQAIVKLTHHVTIGVTVMRSHCFFTTVCFFWL